MCFDHMLNVFTLEFTLGNTEDVEEKSKFGRENVRLATGPIAY